MSELLDELPCSYLSFQDDGKIISCNATLCLWLGVSKDELIGKSIEAIFTLPSRIFYNTHFFPLIKLHSKANEIFLTLRSTDNQTIPVLAYASQKNNDSRFIIDCILVPVRERKQYEEQILLAKRQAENALKENKQLEELTKSLEIQSLELDQQVQRQRAVNENLVQFSKIISHDLQEPIRKIQIYVDMILRDAKTNVSDTSKNYFSKIGIASEKLKSLTTALQQYLAVDGEKIPGQVDLNNLIQTAKSKAIVTRHFADFDLEVEHMPRINGYLNQLELLFYHLIDNSIQFRNPHRRLAIHVNCMLLEENIFKNSRSRYKYKEHLRISFTDNGIGFSEQYKHDVFELLKKGDNSSSGLGLGLSLVKKVVSNHSGMVRVDSQPGIGTRFEIELPTGKHE